MIRRGQPAAAYGPQEFICTQLEDGERTRRMIRRRQPVAASVPRSVNGFHSSRPTEVCTLVLQIVCPAALERAWTEPAETMTLRERGLPDCS